MCSRSQCTGVGCLRAQSCAADQSSNHTPSIALRMHAPARSCPDVTIPGALRPASGSRSSHETKRTNVSQITVVIATVRLMFVRCSSSLEEAGSRCEWPLCHRSGRHTSAKTPRSTTFPQAYMSAKLCRSGRITSFFAAQNIDLHVSNTKQYLADFGAGLQLQPGCGRGRLVPTEATAASEPRPRQCRRAQWASPACAF
jgi:hypothetical protein